MRYTWNGSYAFDIRVQKNVTLDLNGHTVKSVGGSDKQHYAILCVDGNGNLTITDSSAEKTGAIVNATTSRPAGKMSVVLYNEAGDITLNGGTFSNQARVDGNYPYVIDSITAGDTSLTINDGVKLVSDGYIKGYDVTSSTLLARKSLDDYDVIIIANDQNSSTY